MQWFATLHSTPRCAAIVSNTVVSSFHISTNTGVLAEVVPATTVQGHANQQLVPPTSTPCDVFSPQISALKLLQPLKQALRMVEAFPQAQGHIQVDRVPKTSRLPCPADACLIQPLHHNLLLLIPVQTSALPALLVPDPLSQFLYSPQPFPFVPRYTLAC
jgi:hypothetical protein